MTGGFPQDVEPGEAPLVATFRGRCGCPAPPMLLPALAGTLPEPPLSDVRAHIAACPLCATLAEVLADAAESPTEAEVTRMTRRLVEGRADRQGYRWGALAAAAGIVVVAGAAYVLMRVDRVAAPPVHSAHATPSEAPPRLPVLALDAPAIELPPEFLTMRSAERDKYAVELERALGSYKRGEYAVAAARLERVVRANPRRLHAQFYFGASLLLRGDAAAAVRPLERARQLAGPGASLYPEATWYLAVALERSGRSVEALEPLSQLCGQRGPRGEQACEGLSRLLNNR